MTRRTPLTGAAGAATLVAMRPTAASATTPVVLFCCAHPDDETLGMSVAVAEHVAAGLNVHVLWLTDGEATGTISEINGDSIDSWWGVRHVPALEGYAPLTRTTLAAARIRRPAVPPPAWPPGCPGR